MLTVFTLLFEGKVEVHVHNMHLYFYGATERLQATSQVRHYLPYSVAAVTCGPTVVAFAIDGRHCK